MSDARAAVRDLDLAFPEYAANVVRIQAKDGGGFIPLILNAVQIARWRQQVRSTRTRFVDLKARQMGFSTMHLAKNLMRCQLISGYSAGLISHSEEHYTKMTTAVREMLSRQPKAFSPTTATRTTDKKISFANGSTYTFGTAAGFEVGRGGTYHSLHFSEFAVWENQQDQLAAALPALPPWGELSIESTPQGFDAFYDLTLEARTDPESDFEFFFAPWWLMPEYRLPVRDGFTPTQEEATLMQRHNLDAEQIMFRRSQIRTLKEKAAQEYVEDPEACFLATGDSYFTADTITGIRSGCHEPHDVELNGLLKVWQPPFAGYPYVIGVDCAEGKANGDYSVAAVLRPGQGTHVATLMDAPPYPASRDGRMNTDAFADKLAMLGRRYNNALLVVERNNTAGGAVLANLKNVHNYPNLYRDGSDPGFATRQDTKSPLLSALRWAMESGDFSTADERVPRQLSDFIVHERTNSGYEKLGARTGSHDDLVMALALAHHGRSRANQLGPGSAPLYVPVWGSR